MIATREAALHLAINAILPSLQAQAAKLPRALRGQPGTVQDQIDQLETLATRPGDQHVVITGRSADRRLVAAADLVVEMTKVKHPMDAGQKGQGGIEW